MYSAAGPHPFCQPSGVLARVGWQAWRALLQVPGSADCGGAPLVVVADVAILFVDGVHGAQ